MVLHPSTFSVLIDLIECVVIRVGPMEMHACQINHLVSFELFGLSSFSLLALELHLNLEW